MTQGNSLVAFHDAREIRVVWDNPRRQNRDHNKRRNASECNDSGTLPPHL
jgi:hypothetical protein